MASLAAAVVLPMACCAAIQLQARYGPKAGSVVNNHRVKVFLSGIADPGTLEHASSLIGETELRTWATTVDGSRRARRAPTPPPCAGWRRPTPCGGSRPATPWWCRATSRRSGSGCARGRTTGSCGPGPRRDVDGVRAPRWWARRSVGTVGP